jgi:hypothetical protein
MIEQIIVGLIVAGAFLSVAKRYLKQKRGGGCGSGTASSCSSCQACSEPVTAPEGNTHRVIPLRAVR